MIQVFSGNNADEVWCQVASALIVTDVASRQASRAGPTTEILHAGMSVANPRQRWVVSRRPAINPAFALAEVVWIVGGRRDAAFLTFFNKQYEKHAGPGPLYHGAYGWRLRSHLGQDQLVRAYEALKRNPQSRQVVLQIWNTADDMPGEDGQPASGDIPCNIVSMLKVRDGSLEWTQVIRSNDVFKGLPYNFVQFTTLQEIMAGWLGLRVGSYNQLSDSLHVYDEDRQNLSLRCADQAPVNNDDLAVPKPVSDAAFAELASRTDRLIEAQLNPTELREASTWHGGPLAHRNVLRVLAAESARRRRWSDLGAELMDGCTNPALTNLWEAWTKRLRGVAKNDSQEGL